MPTPSTPQRRFGISLKRINVKGVWFGCKHAVLSLRRFKKTTGSIISTASVVALVGIRNATASIYREQRRSPRFESRASYLFMHARDSDSNALCPAPLNTPLLQDWLGDDKPKRQRREIHFPAGRFGEAIEQAQAVLFLASDESSFINRSGKL